MDLPIASDNPVEIKELDLSRMWLLEEGHCLRSQVVNLCDLRQKQLQLNNIDYQSGSIETLKRMVETTDGITILPELALQDLNENQKQHIRYFQKPVPAREISLVTYRHEIKRRLIGALKEELLLHIPENMKHNKGIDVMPIEKAN
jgi:LysR family hydrogen peroxide-inducible transcriptional activator